MATSMLKGRAQDDCARTWQFSVRSLMLAIALVSFALAWCRWFGAEYGWLIFYPGFYGLCSVSILLAACFLLISLSGCQAAWNLIAIGWLFVVGNVFYGIMQAFQVVSGIGPPLAQAVQEGVYCALVSAVSVPLFCTIPSLYVLIVAYRSRPQSLTRWIYYALALALADTVLIVIMVSFTFGTWGR